MATVTDLTAWYATPAYACGPHDDEARCGVLGEAYRFTAYATRRADDGPALVLLETPGGRCLLETRGVAGARVVWFDYAPAGGGRRTRFWMNASSVADLGRLVRRSPARRPFADLFLGV